MSRRVGVWCAGCFFVVLSLISFVSAEKSLAADETGAEPSAVSAEGGSENTDAEVPEITPSKNPHAPDAKVEIPDISIPEDPASGAVSAFEAPTLPPTADPTTESAEPAEPTKPLYAGYDELQEELVTDFGFAGAQKAVKEMYDDIGSGINTRRVNSVYGKWRGYAAGVLTRTNSLSTGLELNNRCRLSWYDKLYRDPISSVFYTEAFSRDLYGNFASGAHGILRGIRQAREKMDRGATSQDIDRLFMAPDSARQAVECLGAALAKAAESQAKAIAPLTDSEVKTVARESFSLFCANTRYGHMVASTGRAKYLIDVMEKLDQNAMYDAAEALIPTVDSRFIARLKEITPDLFETIEIDGQTCQRVVTEAGNIIIGGPEDNVWDLDKIENLVCLIDLGGNDVYKEGTCNPDRPVLAIFDLGDGNDKFDGTKAGIQGGSILGVSLLFNEKGDDSYTARDIAQGSTIGGAGILIDNDGNDRYLAFKRVQGHALEGFGALIDRGGNDDYHAALLAQGLGNPRGFGLLLDKNGDDHYYVGGFYEDSYPEHPGYDGWGQGIGCGLRGVACGGIGALLEGAGDDVYEYDYFAHGGGYWMAVGFARDFGGNDVRVGATLKAYTGGNRSQARWQRFSNGFGCHYALGFLFDDAGDDRYNGTIMGLGMAWDLSAGFLVDFDGNDIYEATGGLTQGTGAEGSLGFLLDYRGDDQYKGRGQGYAMGNITYHQAYNCGGNFSFVVDHGGLDQYGSGAKNNMMSQRGTATGFIIDRPTSQELAEMAERGEDISLIEQETKVQRPIQNISSTDYGVEQALQGLSDSMTNRSGNNNGPTGPFGGRWGGRR